MLGARPLLTRWLGALAAPTVFLSWLLLMIALWIRWGTVSHFIADGIHDPATVHFALKSLAAEILPLYLGIGFILFFLAMGAAKLLRLWAKTQDAWSFRHAFWLTLGLLGAVHAILWWEVPTTLWVMLGLNRLPMALELGIVFTLCVLALWKGLSWPGAKTAPKAFMILVCFGLAAAALWLPRTLEESIWKLSPASGHPAKVLMISLDGLRQDTAMEAGFDRARGFKSYNAYSALPATRLEWSIIWGGDPRHYSVSNLFPSLDELEGKAPYEILDTARDKGLKARFYIDDGGTVGLADKVASFDEVGMPAPGWENFLNSNLAVHLPLYAAWMNVLRVFPTTTPWTPRDLGLRAALDRGRGADWVMYHSCLAHQPIFLDRGELRSIPEWWKLSSGKMAPRFSVPDDAEIDHWRPEYSPFLAYQIRVRSILDAWIAIWNTLPSDADYGPASRFLMTDHGERFYHVTDDVQLGGVHGYGLDPWETRIPLCLDGPGVPSGTDTTKALSLLTVRDAIAKRLLDDAPITPEELLASDDAPMRMFALIFTVRPDDPHDYLEMDTHEFVEGVRVLPGGVWFMKFRKPPEEREKELTYAEAKGRILKVYRPLKQGGCRLFTYDGYQQVSIQELDEKAFTAAKAAIDSRFLKDWKGNPPNP